MDIKSETDPIAGSPAIPAPAVERPDRGVSLDARGDSPARPINYRQEKFCAHYALSGNAAEAARQAGYSERSSQTQGYRLSRRPRVRDRVYEIRVARACQFGPVLAFARLEHLFFQASEAKDYRGAAAILTLQARLAGVESWMPPSAVADAKVRRKLGLGRAGESPRASTVAPRLGRGALGTKGRDPFDNLTEQGDIAFTAPENVGGRNAGQ